MIISKDVLRVVLFPLIWIKRRIVSLWWKYLQVFNLRKYADVQYYQRLKKRIDWESPKDLNEKIQWMKFYSDTTQWSRLSDKYRVREYIKEKGLESLLVKLYGVWDNAEDIDWSSLPTSFVMKVNNGSGDVLICREGIKSLNIPDITRKYNDLLKSKFWRLFAEPHYSIIKPCIIAEEMLDCSNQCIPTDSLIDYKVWCFSGKPFCIWTCYNRTPETVEVGAYDLEWNYHEEWSVFTHHYVKAKKRLPKPMCLEQMLHDAAILSNDFPEVRVDFYVVGNNLYFGEMTFTSKGGYMDFYTDAFLRQMGDMVILPSRC